MAMGQLLTTRASVDSHQRMLVSHTKIAIKEGKAFCTATIQDAEANYTTTIREAETACVDCTYTLQWSLDDFEHARLGMQGHKKGRAGLPILSGGVWGGFTSLSCRSLGGTHVPLTVADGECVLSCPFGYLTA